MQSAPQGLAVDCDSVDNLTQNNNPCPHLWMLTRAHMYVHICTRRFAEALEVYGARTTHVRAPTVGSRPRMEDIRCAKSECIVHYLCKQSMQDSRQPQWEAALVWRILGVKCKCIVFRDGSFVIQETLKN